MKFLFGALALALLLSTVSADFTAYFSPNSSAMALSVPNLTYRGHYGNYTVFAGAFPLPSSVRVSGAEASQPALAEELSWLQNQSELETSCDPSKLLIASWDTSYCNDTGQWTDCSQEPACIAQQPPEPGVLGTALPASGGAQNEAAPQAAYNNAPQPAPVAPSAGVATAAERKAAAETPAQPQSKSPTLEQALELFGAFVLVIIVSYLLMQNRGQETPQEERLLENETRAGILQELSGADRIPTDLSNKLGKSKATIVEHLDALLDAGFVEKLSTPGRKFVYYRLTRKGKQALLRRAG